MIVKFLLLLSTTGMLYHYICACVSLCLCLCVCVCMCACMHVYVIYVVHDLEAFPPYVAG